MKQADALKILKAGRNVYLTGAAGSGKTYVLNEYIEYLKNRGVEVAVTASTGIAATHIGGVTIHSWSGIGVRDTLSEAEIENLIQKEYLYRRFDRARVLIIDEVSMLNPNLFDAVERVCRAMKQNEDPFGGLQVVLSGDFFQLPPIVKDSSSVKFINTSDAWKRMDIRVCYLEEQFRQSDNMLEGILNEIRDGEVSEESYIVLSEQNENELGEGVTPTRLYTHNADVDAQNAAELKKLPGEEHSFYMTSTGKGSMVESLKKSVLAPEELILKEDAVVMFVKNSFESGYVNGTLGVVEEIDDEGVPVVRTYAGKVIRVYASEWAVEEEGKVKARVEQLPLRLAWAITIHKSQGMSMDAAEIDLSKSFVPGQGYVALSRLRTLAGLVLKGMNQVAFAVHPDVAQLNAHLLRESEKWGKIIMRFSDKEMEKMHEDFIKSIGGTIDKKKIAENKAKEKEGPTPIVPTHEQTRVLIGEGLTLDEMVAKRGKKLGTILAHFEKIKEEDSGFDFSAYKPKPAQLKKILAAFKAEDDTKLSPVYYKLDKKYTYEDIRLARLFLK